MSNETTGQEAKWNKTKMVPVSVFIENYIIRLRMHNARNVVASESFRLSSREGKRISDRRGSFAKAYG